THAPTLTYRLSLHDALPICWAFPIFWAASSRCTWEEPVFRACTESPDCRQPRISPAASIRRMSAGSMGLDGRRPIRNSKTRPVRSEEHTSELQSLRHLVCRL